MKTCRTYSSVSYLRPVLLLLITQDSSKMKISRVKGGMWRGSSVQKPIVSKSRGPPPPHIFASRGAVKGEEAISSWRWASSPQSWTAQMLLLPARIKTVAEKHELVNRACVHLSWVQNWNDLHLIKCVLTGTCFKIVSLARRAVYRPAFSKGKGIPPTGWVRVCMRRWETAPTPMLYGVSIYSNALLSYLGTGVPWVNLLVFTLAQHSQIKYTNLNELVWFSCVALGQHLLLAPEGLTLF